jgi:hypothetical protein
VPRDLTNFFSADVAESLVRDGAEFRHPSGLHTVQVVYSEMLLQICRDYQALPDPRTLTLGEILFFYRPLRRELKRHQKAEAKREKELSRVAAKAKARTKHG